MALCAACRHFRRFERLGPTPDVRAVHIINEPVPIRWHCSLMDAHPLGLDESRLEASEAEHGCATFVDTRVAVAWDGDRRGAADRRQAERDVGERRAAS